MYARTDSLTLSFADGDALHPHPTTPYTRVSH